MVRARCFAYAQEMPSVVPSRRDPRPRKRPSAALVAVPDDDADDDDDNYVPTTEIDSSNSSLPGTRLL